MFTLWLRAENVCSTHTSSKFAKLAKFPELEEPNGSLLSLNASKGAWLEPNGSFLNASVALEWVGGAGAALRGVLLACLGGAGRGGGALLFFGGNAGVGLSDLFGWLIGCDVNGSEPKGSDYSMIIPFN